VLPTALAIAGASAAEIAAEGLDGLAQWRALLTDGGGGAPTRSAMLVHADDLGFQSDAMGLTTGAYIAADTEAGTLWKLVVNSTEAGWCRRVRRCCRSCVFLFSVFSFLRSSSVSSTLLRVGSFCVYFRSPPPTFLRFTPTLGR
jgi:hypothetical protein